MADYVIDVGCAVYADSDSVAALIEMYHPWELHGYEPGVGPGVRLSTVPVPDDRTQVVYHRQAAWTFDGLVQFRDNDSGGRVDPEGERAVRCVDLARVILAFPSPVVLKLDCEGGEYELIPHLLAKEADRNVAWWLIEWHGDPIRSLPFDNWECWSL